MRMFWARAGSLLCFIFAFLLSAFLALELREFGFPDGFLTELDRARRVLFPVAIALNLGLGVYFLYFAFSYRQGANRKPFLVALLVYGLLLLVLFFVDYALILQLDGWAGG